MSQLTAQETDRLVFQAELRPYRSLSRNGTLFVVASACCVSLGVTTLFWHLGAWPIAGFNGAELALCFMLLHAHRRSARHAEILLLSERHLLVRSIDDHGRTIERRLPNSWLNVMLVERPGRVPALLAGSRGKQIELASQLGEAEKRDLAIALQEAIHRLHNPVFDNPQLRNSGP